ncbi:MAG: hypothetical protein KZQ94_14935 [Candidatus Thiodiazotropha sp. (ex Troendleina suluensis)]|nr:hypothetical protein [Candidatus Thiodiazotropha sp. (ex Troendleina suluensis)]
MKTLLRMVCLVMVCTALIPVSIFADEKPDSDWFKKSPLGAGILSDLIREGDISPGDDYTVEVGGRFHRVHAKFMAINCVSCHAGVDFPDDLQYLRREEFPIAAYPGAVDRSICLGCHRGEGALAEPFYKMPGQ